jgi:hypothetical protein
MPRKPDRGGEPNLELPSLRLGRRRRRPDPGPAPASRPELEPTAAAEPDPAPVAEPTHREPTPSAFSRVPGPCAAALTGIVCGLLGVALTSGSLRGCEAVRGVGSCGGIGLFALLLILVVEIFLGAALLRGFRVPDAFSTSFLGVGLVAVAVMLFLLGQLGSPWMLLVVPLVTAVTYVMSWWVTTTFVETD